MPRRLVRLAPVAALSFGVAIPVHGQLLVQSERATTAAWDGFLDGYEPDRWDGTIVGPKPGQQAFSDFEPIYPTSSGFDNAVSFGVVAAVTITDWSSTTYPHDPYDLRLPGLPPLNRKSVTNYDYAWGDIYGEAERAASGFENAGESSFSIYDDDAVSSAGYVSVARKNKPPVATATSVVGLIGGVTQGDDAVADVGGYAAARAVAEAQRGKYRATRASSADASAEAAFYGTFDVAFATEIDFTATLARLGSASATLEISQTGAAGWTPIASWSAEDGEELAVEFSGVLQPGRYDIAVTADTSADAAAEAPSRQLVFSEDRGEAVFDFDLSMREVEFWYYVSDDGDIYLEQDILAAVVDPADAPSPWPYQYDTVEQVSPTGWYVPSEGAWHDHPFDTLTGPLPEGLTPEDFVAQAEAFTGVAIAAVPEPATATLMLAAAGLLRRRRAASGEARRA